LPQRVFSLLTVALVSERSRLSQCFKMQQKNRQMP
jgi:hypothetical protein